MAQNIAKVLGHLSCECDLVRPASLEATSDKISIARRVISSYETDYINPRDFLVDGLGPSSYQLDTQKVERDQNSVSLEPYFSQPSFAPLPTLFARIGRFMRQRILSKKGLTIPYPYEQINLSWSTLF